MKSGNVYFFVTGIVFSLVGIMGSLSELKAIPNTATLMFIL